jgi:hypothetical protein
MDPKHSCCFYYVANPVLQVCWRSGKHLYFFDRWNGALWKIRVRPCRTGGFDVIINSKIQGLWLHSWIRSYFGSHFLSSDLTWYRSSGRWRSTILLCPHSFHKLPDCSFTSKKRNTDYRENGLKINISAIQYIC